MTSASRALLRACVLVGLLPLLSLGLAWAASQSAGRAATEAELARSTLAAARAQLEPQDAKAALGAAPARLLMQGATIGVSGAAFQSLLTDLAALSGATLERVDPILAEQAGVLTQMHSRATFSGTDGDIMNLVINLEAAEPLIFLDRLEMIPLEDDGERLSVELELSAYAAAGANP
jgi:hypothetical protein